MKIVCNFCKTEYSVDMVPNGPVKCAVCGNTWVVHRSQQKSSILMFIASVCALLAALVFAVAVLYQHKVTEIKEKPLVAEITEIKTEVDENNIRRFIVSGTVINRSEQIYGVPGLAIISYDKDGRIVERQRFMPSATLLDAGGRVQFVHKLSVPVTNVEKISVELENQGI